MAWLYIVGASLMEIGLFTLLKTYGFMRSWHTVIMIAMAMSILFILQFSLKGLPLSTAYAAFVGIATVGTVLAGIFLFQESTSWPRLAFIGLIVAGVIGLRLLENPQA
jgi:quaternary ammonium compound-resistance protein SugE